MHSSRSTLLLLCIILQAAAACSSGQWKLGDPCSSKADYGVELYCYNCSIKFAGKKVDVPFNEYASLTTHNSFSIHGKPFHTGVPRLTFYNQDDSVTDQLNNGVRALMLDVYDFRDDTWLCHSKGGKCFSFTAFEPAIDTMREIEAFLSSNPSEIVTLILEDHVRSHHGLSKLFEKPGLMKYWFPVSNMPRNGEDWPLVRDMIKLNHRLLVFTSNRSKQSTEGIAYQWNYMVENQYGDGGMDPRACYNRSESPALGDRTRSLVLVNYFSSIPLWQTVVNYFGTIPLWQTVVNYFGTIPLWQTVVNYFGTIPLWQTVVNYFGTIPLWQTVVNYFGTIPLWQMVVNYFGTIPLWQTVVNYFGTIPLWPTAGTEHSLRLPDVLHTCYTAAGNRWANFLAVDYYKNDGGGAFKAMNMLNGMLFCGRDDVHGCTVRLEISVGETIDIFGEGLQFMNVKILIEWSQTLIMVTNGSVKVVTNRDKFMDEWTLVRATTALNRQPSATGPL